MTKALIALLSATAAFNACAVLAEEAASEPAPDPAAGTQSSADPTQGPTTETADHATVGEIVVTAQRRAQKIQDVPISITALSADSLANAGADSFTDLETAVPGLKINSFGNYVLPFIRGIGSLLQGPSAVSSVAVYIDDVYSARSQASIFQLDNVESLEVLKGPQATLYGRNATGGAIKVGTHTTRPGDEFEARLKADFGRFDERRYSGFVSGGLTDWMAANVAVYSAERDGYMHGLEAANGNRDPYDLSVKDRDGEALDAWGVASKLTFVPTENLLITASLRKSYYDDTVGSGSRNLDPDTTNAALAGGTLDFSGVRPHHSYYHYNGGDAEYAQYSLHATYSFKNFDLSYIGGYSTEDYVAGLEVVGASTPTLGFAGQFDTDGTSHELRLVSTADSAWHWIVGLTHFEEGVNKHIMRQHSVIGAPGPCTPTGAPPPFPPVMGTCPSAFTDWDTQAQSAYVDVTRDVGERVQLIVGLRYTDEEFNADSRNEEFDPLNSQGRNDLSGKATDDSLDYRLVASYKTDAMGLFYGSVSTGFKSGQINTTNLSSPPIKPEEIVTFEIGNKGTFLDGRLRASTAAYYNDLKDFQALRVSLALGGAQFAVNAQKVVSYGIESELIFAATENLTLNGGFNWLIKAEYDKFEAPGDLVLGLTPVNATGNQLAGAADFDLIVGGEYTLPQVWRATDLVLAGQVQHNSGVWYEQNNIVGSGGLDDDGYTLVNAVLSWRGANRLWTVSAYGTNLFDKQYVAGGIDIGDGVIKSGIDGAPRMYGVSLQLRF